MVYIDYIQGLGHYPIRDELDGQRAPKPVRKSFFHFCDTAILGPIFTNPDNRHGIRQKVYTGKFLKTKFYP